MGVKESMGPCSGCQGNKTEHTMILTPWSPSQWGGGGQIPHSSQLQNNATHSNNTVGVFDSFKMELETSLEFAFGVGLFVFTLPGTIFLPIPRDRKLRQQGIICQDHSRPRTPVLNHQATPPRPRGTQYGYSWCLPVGLDARQGPSSPYDLKQLQVMEEVRCSVLLISGIRRFLPNLPHSSPFGSHT